MLGPAKVNPIGHTFDAVLALAAVVMTHRPNARADIIHDVSERVELCRPVRVCEPPTAQQDQLVGQLAQPRARASASSAMKSSIPATSLRR